jgi:hypothetical protein
MSNFEVTQLFEQTITYNLNPDQWVLPETEEYLRANDKQQRRTSIIDSDTQQEGELNLFVK